MNDKYLIVAIYDSGYGFKINDCGHIEEKWLSEFSNTKTHEAYNAYTSYNDEEFTKWLLDKYKDYGFIVVVEDAYIDVIKDEMFKKNEAQWIGVNYDGYADGQPVFDIFECSNCKEEYYTDDVKELPHYCPNCGRRMKENNNG